MLVIPCILALLALIGVYFDREEWYISSLTRNLFFR